MPKLWTETINAHRHAVRETIMESATKLAMEHGISALTMLQIAEVAGIGRATLYKYFPDIESILAAWHERMVLGHLEQLHKVAGGHGSSTERLHAVLKTYADNAHQSHSAGLAAMLHRGPAVASAHLQLQGLVVNLLEQGVKSGGIRRDIAPKELALFCLHALTAAETLSSKPAVDRLLSVILAGLRPPQA